MKSIVRWFATGPDAAKAELVDLVSLSPIDYDAVIDSVNKITKSIFNIFPEIINVFSSTSRKAD